MINVQWCKQPNFSISANAPLKTTLDLNKGCVLKVCFYLLLQPKDQNIENLFAKKKIFEKGPQNFSQTVE